MKMLYIYSSIWIKPLNCINNKIRNCYTSIAQYESNHINSINIKYENAIYL